MLRLICSLFVSAKMRIALFILLLNVLPLFGMPIPSIEDLTLEEKIGQLLLVHFNGEDYNEEAEQLIHQAHVGGFIYYQWANGLNDPLQIQRLSNRLQQSTRQKKRAIPLLIAIDQEGGVVNRITKGVTVFPGNYALGQGLNLHFAEECAFAMAKEFMGLGINMNLAPVVDVNSNPYNPIIGIRAFSSNPAEVVCLGEKALAGYQRAGMIATLKHFPGHGDVKQDSHETLPIVNKSLGELQELELLPFIRLSPYAPALITAHLMVRALDPHYCTTFSERTIQGFLRGKMGYEGVVFTDSLVMKGLIKQCQSIQEAALRSLQAGHDILLLGGKQLNEQERGFELTGEDVLNIHQYLVEAVSQGLLSEDCINASVRRILILKQTYKLFEGLLADQDVSHISTTENQQLARKIAQNAIYSLNGPFPLFKEKNQSIGLILPDILKSEMEQTEWPTVGHLSYYAGLNPTEEGQKRLVEQNGQADTCIFFSYNAWKYRGQIDLFNRLKQQCSKVIVIVVCDPQDASLFSNPDGVVCTFSPTVYSLQAAKEYVIGKVDE